MTPTVDWPGIRLAYVNQEGSLRQLSQRFNVPLRTLERKCSEQGWRRAVERAGGIVAAVAAEVAVQEGERLGLTAAGLVERTLAEIPTWLDRIEALASSGSVDPHQLKALVASWRSVIELGRESFGLDEKASPVCIHLHTMNGARAVKVVEDSDSATQLIDFSATASEFSRTGA